MIDLWQYEIRADKNNTMFARVQRSTLEEFVKKVDPYARVTDTNGEKWVLRYIQEELGYGKGSIQSVKIQGKEFTTG